LTLVLLLTSLLWHIPGLASPDLTRVIYADALAAGWQNWSWATVSLSATSPVHNGSHSIAVTFDAWEGLYLYKAGVDSLGVSYLRFYIHGGGSGGQALNVFMNLEVNGNPQNGPAIPVQNLPANGWVEIGISIASLNPSGATITGITWQDATGHSQPTLYIDDIALVSLEDPQGPSLTDASVNPRSIPADGTTTMVVRGQASDPQGTADIAAVILDASSLGGGSVSLRDDGRSNDGLAQDGLYGAVLSVPPGTPAGERFLLLTAQDQAGHQTSLPLGVVNVLATPGGAIPAVLPQHIGWGSNAWSETPGEDWQVNSGVPWDYVYQYITYGWESWGSNFVSRFVHQAWEKDFVPIVTVYMMLGAPPNCGETSLCYAQKLQNAATVQAYLSSLERAAQEASGSKTVIFNLEPDFYGYMQQLSNSSSRPLGVTPNDPSSYPVALNKSGYANNLAGFGRYLVDLIHTTAPNALAAPMASMWATNSDPLSATSAAAMQMAESTAAFIDAMGGAQADLLVVEWSDRDAGSGLRPWWDDTDQETPRPTRAIIWENALSHAAQKRLILWQMPVGNMALNNTCDHYQDNRAAYAFSHPRDLADAGVTAIVFGGGADCMTQVWSDGGFAGTQGAIAYSAPAAPGGLTAGSGTGYLTPVRWQENSEPDLWGYHILYRVLPAGTQYRRDVGRRNADLLPLLQAGDWEIRIVAIDAMGNESPPSAPVNVTISAAASLLHLPTVRR
jgi:hypothetical protein